MVAQEACRGQGCCGGVVAAYARRAYITRICRAYMTTVITIRAEITGHDPAAALGITARGHTPVLQLCRKLVAAGVICPKAEDRPRQRLKLDAMSAG
jgi:hypothetical protein